MKMIQRRPRRFYIAHCSTDVGPLNAPIAVRDGDRNRTVADRDLKRRGLQRIGSNFLFEPLTMKEYINLTSG